MAKAALFQSALLLALALPIGCHSSRAGASEPVIDMHVHAAFTERTLPVRACTGDQQVTYLAIDPSTARPGAETERCLHPILSETRRDRFRRNTIAALRHAGVRRAVLIGPPDELRQWQSDDPSMFIPASTPGSTARDETSRLRHLQSTGAVEIFAEVGLQYQGIRADDPRAESFWALAEERDVPVGIHLGLGMSLFGDELRADPYRAELTSPFQLEAVLKKHPRLRIYVMHAASPLIDEMIAMLFTYPNLYVDISATDWNVPRAQFYSELKRLVDAGFSERIMFGSDQTIWPQAIELAVQTIRQAPFLTASQRRDILYNNAARFLRLTPEQIARDHTAASAAAGKEKGRSRNPALP